MNKKILIGSILSVVILILVSFPTVISEKENPKIELLDNKNEIISFIRGKGWPEIPYGIEIGEIRNLDILTNKGYLHMTSIAINPERIIPLRITIFARPRHLDIPLFYGILIGSPVPYSPHRIIGFAIGDIEWW
jgi:hypothetical protein